MTELTLTRAVLIADVTGSTPLYESVGDAEAVRRVGRCVDVMRDIVEANGGVFVAAKGDDVLATFEVAEGALSTIEAILSRMPMGGLYVHAGLHHGSIVATRDDIYGDAVNLTARLASAANPGEVLISSAFEATLGRQAAARLRPLSALRLKGRSVPVDVFSLAADTQMPDVGEPTVAIASTGDRPVLRLVCGGEERLLCEGGSLALGRAPENDIVLTERWVSRRHATIMMVAGRVQLTDHSSYGSFLAMADASEIVARRESVIVTGSGRLSLGLSTEHAEATVLLLEMTTG